MSVLLFLFDYIFLYFLQSPGCGFIFDTQTTNVIPRQMAGTFYNPGTIRVNSVLDTGANAFSLFTIGKFQVLATNIFSPGTVTLGYDGQIQMTGNNVNLTRSSLSIENINTYFANLGFLSTAFLYYTFNSLDYGVGTDTNQDWVPAISLQPSLATSSQFHTQLYPFSTTQMTVSNSVPFSHQTFVGTNYALTRAVFLNGNPGPNVVQSVYFGGNSNPYLGAGNATIQWAGAYIDPSTGLAATNYIYLNDVYVRGGNTNNPVINGLPSNFTITELNSPASFTVPTAPTNYPSLTRAVVTNNYSYGYIQFIPSTVATNATLQNTYGALTNLPGRIQINASQDLDLTMASISGANYMSLTATNNFKGSSGASIFSPYSDINLGVTNGFLSVSNLLDPTVPNWSGTLQVWSSDWIEVDANGFTNEFRVLLVNPNLIPTTAPVVQNLTLHGTNLFLSDIYNVIGKLSIDATSLTLTTNLETYGFGSQDGELNWYYPSTLNSVQIPNLHWLTNNGAIRSANLAVFGSAANIYGAFINNGLIADQGSTIWSSNFLSCGTISNGTGGFALQALTATITNASIVAGGDVSITTGSLLTSNLQMQVGKALTLTVSGSLTDTGPSPTNASIWTVGSIHSDNYGVGFKLSMLPTNAPVGDLLGTTITNVCWTNYVINNTWAGLDRGYNNSGYSNNAALGRLVLDPLSTRSVINFTGTGSTSNAIYVDSLLLINQATNLLNSVLPEVVCSPNFVIYYAQAIQNGVSVAEKLNHANGDHFRWMPTYVGYYSSTNLVYPVGVTNTYNAALASSTLIDSDSDGTPNGGTGNGSPDPTPFLVPQQLNFSVLLTNVAPPSVRLQWTTIPRATNYIYYRTNLLVGNWIPFTNFNSYYYGSNSTTLAFPNPSHVNWFPSPQVYSGTAGSDNYQQGRVSVYDAITNAPRYYQIEVNPWLLAP